MKILHLSYSDYKGGASRAALRIHQGLLKKKISSFFKVNIASNSGINTKNIIRPNLLRGHFNKIKSVTESVISKILKKDNFVKNSISFFPTQLHKFINKSDYDIIHMHWINGETISIEDIGKITKPIVWTIHDMWPFSGSKHYTFKKQWKYGYSKNNTNTDKNIMNLKNVNIEKFVWSRKLKNWKNKIYIVGVSKWLSNCASESYLMKRFPVLTINNTLDTNFWKPKNKNACRRYFNIPQNIKLIGFSSLGNNNTYLKGKDLFLSAIEKITHAKEKIGIFSIGDSNNFFKEINNIKIYTMPRLDNDEIIKKFYNSLDLIVVPSRLESFGQIASEASSCGIPVVAFNATGLKDVILHKKNGWLAKPYKAKQLAKGIDYILGLKPRSYKKICLSGVKLANQNFSSDLISDKYIKLYRKILRS